MKPKDKVLVTEGPSAGLVGMVWTTHTYPDGTAVANVRARVNNGTSSQWYKQEHLRELTAEELKDWDTCPQHISFDP